MSLWPGAEKPVAADSGQTKSDSPEKLSVDAHKRSDIDAGPTAQHHSLGVASGQASPGPHIHDGKDSRNITSVSVSDFTAAVLAVISANPNTVVAAIKTHMLSQTFTGSRNTDSWRQQVMTAFASLGAVDSTTV